MNSTPKCLFAAFVAVLAVGLAPGLGRADALDDVLMVLSTAGVVDPAVVEAKPMIQCLLDGKSVEQCAKLAAGKAQGLVPNDPKIQKVVDVFHAVKAQDWLKVFLLAGEQTVCSLVPGGAVKDLFCGEVFAIAKPVITSAYKAVKNGDILTLVTLVGVDYACSLLPNVPGASQACGVLGDIAKGVVQGAKEGWAAFEGLTEEIEGQSQHMPVETYYLKYWRSWLQYAVVKQLHTGQPHFLYAGRYAGSSTSCVEYFDSHKMSKSNAEKVCSAMKKRFTQEVSEAAKVYQAFPAAYFAGALAPKTPGWAVAYHGNIESFANQFAQPTSWNGYALQSYLLNSGAPFKKLWEQCNAQKPLTLPPMPDQVPKADKANMGTAISWACTKSGQLLAGALTQEKAKLDGLTAKVKASGCGGNPIGKPGIHFLCPTYDAQRACSALYPSGASKTESLCWVDGYAAEKALAKQIVGQLGAKRCAEVPKTGYMGLVDVACTRPWKQAKCKSLVAALSQGAPEPPALACLPKTDPKFDAAKQEAAAILKSLNVKSTGTGYVDPKTGLKQQLALVTGAGCQGTWDPLRLICKDPEAQKALSAKLPDCATDPNQDGADAPCYGGPLSASLKPKPTAKAAPGAGLVPGDASSAGRKAPAGALPPSRGEVARNAPTAAMPLPGGTTAGTPLVLSKPAITVVGATAAIQNNCQSPQPALIATVSLRNTGGPLSANEGTVSIKEIGGATNLSSTGIPLPALSSGETRRVSIPVITLRPYSTLPGTHRLGVHLNPQTKGGQSSFNKPAGPHPFGVTFPAGYCQQKIAPRLPAAGTLTPGETRGLNPQPEPPSRMPLKLPGR